MGVCGEGGVEREEEEAVGGGFQTWKEGGRGGQVWGTSVGGVQSAWKERTWNGGFFLELSNLE